MSTLHDTDFYSWTQQQSALLRSANFAELDVINLIDEIEDMGNSERRALESRLTVLLVHLLKWLYQPARQGRSWEGTIRGQRHHVRKILQENPGLKSRVGDLFIAAYANARFDAMVETDLALDVFPIRCPWIFPQAMDDNFWPK